MLERCCEHGTYYSGGGVGFYSGDIRELTNDLKVNIFCNRVCLRLGQMGFGINVDCRTYSNRDLWSSGIC